MAGLQETIAKERVILPLPDFQTNSGSLDLIGVPGLVSGKAIVSTPLMQFAVEQARSVVTTFACNDARGFTGQTWTGFADLSVFGYATITCSAMANVPSLFDSFSTPQTLTVVGRGPAVTDQTPHETALKANETISSAAVNLARSLGLYEALQRTITIIREEMGSCMTRLNVDRKNDPEEENVSVLCFTITTRESVDLTLDRDRHLRAVLSNQIPPNASLYFSFVYDFE